MISKRQIIILLIVLLFAPQFSNCIYSQEKSKNGSVDLEIISYDELMNMLVVTASKEEQKIKDAPAVIDVFTEQQIKDMGVKNLYELISYLPGIEMLETYFGRTVLNFRGVQNYHYNNKVLMMVNGIPYYEPVNGSYFLENIPIVAIKRVEIIRGPGSSLYGTNAYSGIINIMTKEISEKNLVELNLGMGSFNTVIAGFSSNISFENDNGISISGSYDVSKGYPFNIKSDENGKSKNIKYYSVPKNIFGTIKFGDFKLNGGYARLKKTVFGLTPNVDYSGIDNSSNLFTNFEYQHSFSEKISTKVDLVYTNYQMIDLSVGYFPSREYGDHPESTTYLTTGGHVFSSSAEITYNFSKEFSNISGVNYESYFSEPYLFQYATDNVVTPFAPYIQEHRSSNFAVYSQIQYKPSQVINFIGGLRLVKDENINDVFLFPRIGIVGRLNESLYIKALYGTAFRTPSIFERNVSTYNVLFGDKLLCPEKIYTFDLSVEGDLNQSTNFRVNAFYQTIQDGITRIQSDNEAEHGPKAAIYTNLVKSEIYGAEFSLNGIINDAAYYGINFSWKNGKNQNDDHNLFGIANLQANGWMNYRFDIYFITPSFQFLGARKGFSSRRTESGQIGEYKLNPYLLFNLNTGVQLGNFQVSISLKNIFDFDYSYPEFIRSKSEEVPGGPGINYFINCEYSLN